MTWFGFLGQVAIDVSGADRVEVIGAQPSLVLAFLVLERPRSLLRDELVDLLWPGTLPVHWEGAARQVVSRARRSLVTAGLAPTVLASSDGVTTLDLGDDTEVDVEIALGLVAAAERALAAGDLDLAAQHAERGQELLRRPFFPASSCRWVSDWRDRIDAAVRRARHAGAEAALRGQRTSVATELARSAVEHDPYDEQATRLLMAAGEQAGNRAAALAAYEALRRRLDEELGVRPSGETEEAYRLLLGAPPEAPERVVARPRSRVSTEEASPFVGRMAELGLLVDTADLAAKGTCRLVVVEGEAGIGKTRLVLELADVARARGASVLWGRCEPGVQVAHGPFADIAEALVTDRPDVVARLGPQASHLAPLVPQLLPTAPQAAPLSTDQLTGRLFRAVSAAIAGAADRPLVVVIDDLHWADDDTLALVRHLVARLADLPCLIVVTMRSATAAVAGALAELERLAPTTSLSMRGLSVDDVAQLLTASGLTLDDPPSTVASVVVSRTSGNALYVTQLLQEAQDSPLPFDPLAVPSAVARLLERRLAGLGEELASLLVLAAVAGPVIDLALVEDCTVLTSEDLLDRFEELCRLRFLEEQAPGRFGFAHDLVRDAVLSATGSTRLTHLHRRIAGSLARSGADAASVAFHYLEAGGACVEDAASWSLAAGRAALTSATWVAAGEHFGNAVRLASEPSLRADALVGLGRAQRAVGRPDAARVTLEDALALATAHNIYRTVAAATLALVGGGGRGVAIDLVDAERSGQLRRALDGLDDDDVDLLVPLLAELALSLVLTADAGERRELCERCLSVARQWGDPGGLATALWARRIALMGPAGTEERLADGREALALPRAEVPPESLLAAHLGQVEDLLELGDRTGAEAVLAGAATLAASLDHPYWSWATACWRTLSTIIDGRCSDAEALAFAALGQQSSGEHPEAVAALGVNLVDIRLFEGRSAEMIELLTAAADENPQIPAYRAVLALCCAEAGDLVGAREAYDRFAGSDFELPADSNWLLAVTVLADAGATLGDADGAARLTELLEPWADRQVVLNCYGGGGSYWGPVAHHLGRLAAVRDDPATARAHLERAIELAEGFGALLFAARSRAALAALV